MILLVVLAAACFSNIQSTNAQSTLRIAFIGVSQPHVNTYTPFVVWIEIENPDSVGHNYKVLVVWEYEQSQNGYINASDFDVIFLSFLPVYSGNQTIRVRLWQDYYDGGSGIDEKTKSVIVERSYPWAPETESLNASVQSLEAEVSRLSDLTNKLTIGIVSLLIVTIVVVVIFWRTTKKRTENSTLSEGD